VQLHRARLRVRDAEHSDDAGPGVERDPPISLKEAQEAVSRAEARAEEARGRAAQLRRQAEADSHDQPDEIDDADDVDGDAEADADADATKTDEHGKSTASLRRSLQLMRSRVRPPKRKTVEAGAATVLVLASLVASGTMVSQHISLKHQHKRATEFAAAARHGVELMMSIDPAHARDNIQSLIDNTTGALQSQLRVTSTFLVKDAQDAKVTTKATVQDVAVESMTGDSAVALVVSESDTTNPDKSKRPPVFWRLSVELKNDGGQFKISKVDFVR
jgi:Mce-associated membrane protein